MGGLLAGQRRPRHICIVVVTRKRPLVLAGVRTVQLGFVLGGSGGILRVPVVGVEPGGTRPHGAFSRARLTTLSTSVDRGNVLRPLSIEGVSTTRCRLITNRHHLETSILTKLQGIPYVILGYSRGRSTVCTLLRGLRQDSLNVFRRTHKVSGLVEHCNLARRRTTGQLNGDRSAVTGGLELLHLACRRRR